MNQNTTTNKENRESLCISCYAFKRKDGTISHAPNCPQPTTNKGDGAISTHVCPEYDIVKKNGRPTKIPHQCPVLRIKL
jgi:hypothetical protein